MNGDWGGLPQSGHLGSDVVQLSQETRRADTVGDATAEAARGGLEALPPAGKLRKLVADLSLGRAMPQDVLARKP